MKKIMFALLALVFISAAGFSQIKVTDRNRCDGTDDKKLVSEEQNKRIISEVKNLALLIQKKNFTEANKLIKAGNPLDYVCYTAKGQDVLLLCDDKYGRNIKSPCSEEPIPLVEAIRQGASYEFIVGMVDRGADVNPYTMKASPVDVADWRGDPKIFNYIMSKSKNQPEDFSMAAFQGKLMTLGYLLEKAGGKASQKDAQDVLMMGAQNGYIKIVDFALEKMGADINLPTEDWTALQAAASHDQLDMVKYLVSKGANVIIKGERITSITEITNAAVKNYLRQKENEKLQEQKKATAENLKKKKEITQEINSVAGISAA